MKYYHWLMRARLNEQSKSVCATSIMAVCTICSMKKSEDILRELYKSASFVIQAIVFKQTGKYIKQQKELHLLASANEKVIVDTFVYLKSGGKVEFTKMSETLFARCKVQLANNR